MNLKLGAGDLEIGTYSPQLCLKRGSGTGVFFLRNFLENPF